MTDVLRKRGLSEANHLSDCTLPARGKDGDEVYILEIPTCVLTQWYDTWLGNDEECRTLAVSQYTWFSTEHLQRHCGASGCGTVPFHSVASMLSKSSNFASFIDIFILVCAMTVKWKMSHDLTLGVCRGVIARGCPRGEDRGSRLRLGVHLGGL